MDKFNCFDSKKIPSEMGVVPLCKLLLEGGDELLSKKVGVDWSGWIPLRLLLLHSTNKAVFVPCQLYYTHTVRNINSEGKHQDLI